MMMYPIHIVGTKALFKKHQEKLVSPPWMKRKLRAMQTTNVNRYMLVNRENVDTFFVRMNQKKHIPPNLLFTRRRNKLMIDVISVVAIFLSYIFISWKIILVNHGFQLHRLAFWHFLFCQMFEIHWLWYTSWISNKIRLRKYNHMTSVEYLNCTVS